MGTPRQNVIAFIRNHIPTEQLEQAEVHWDPRVIQAGTTVDLGGPEREMSYDSTLALVDLAPNYNWAHPCLMVLIREGGNEGEVVEASFPPRSRGYPKTFQLILKNGKEVPEETASIHE